MAAFRNAEVQEITKGSGVHGKVSESNITEPKTAVSIEIVVQRGC